MSTTIAAGASAQITLAIGDTLVCAGTGVATLGPGSFANQQVSIQGQSVIGPFDHIKNIYVTAIGVPVVCSTNTDIPKAIYILAQTAVPTILPSSGSSNASGQITLTTALPYTPIGTVQIYLPSGVVTAGSAGTGAGLYSVVFSTTAICQIQGTGIVTANGAYTQTTASDITLATVTVPGGAMGANGVLRFSDFAQWPNNANNKLFIARLSATTVMTRTVTTTVSGNHLVQVRNRGAQNAQVIMPPSAGNAFSTSEGTAALVYPTIDTSANQNLTFTGQLAVATDYIILEGYTVEVLPKA